MKVISVTIPVKKRATKAKKNYLNFILKFIPQDGHIVQKKESISHNGTKLYHYTDLPIKNSAYISINSFQKLFLYFLVGIVGVGLLINWLATFIPIISLLAIF